MVDKPFVVLASRYDSVARRFVRRYASRGARLLTPDDLSRIGWYHRLGHPHSSTAVIAGRMTAARDITGVVIRLPYVGEQDLAHIIPADRSYVASEMSAFLLPWLLELSCPLLNRPTPHCLAGPYWRHEQWVQTAHRLGISVFPMRRHIRFPDVVPQKPAPKGVTVTLVGQRHIGTAEPGLVDQARALARAAGVDLLAVRFSSPAAGARFVEASLWPDIGNRAVGDSILEYLRGNVAPISRRQADR